MVIDRPDSISYYAILMAGEHGQHIPQDVATATDTTQVFPDLNDPQKDLLLALHFPNKDSAKLVRNPYDLTLLAEMVKKESILEHISSLWDRCVVDGTSTAEESFALGILASALVYDELPESFRAKIGELKRARGSVVPHYQEFTLCPQAETNMSQATLLDGIAFGVNDAGEKVAALKIYPGRKSVLVLHPVALDTGILVPQVLYEVSDSRTKARLEQSLFMNESTIPLLSETEFAVMRPVNPLMKDILGKELPPYMRRDVLGREIPYLIPGDDSPTHDRYTIAYKTRHEDDML